MCRVNIGMDVGACVCGMGACVYVLCVVLALVWVLACIYVPGCGWLRVCIYTCMFVCFLFVVGGVRVRALAFALNSCRTKLRNEHFHSFLFENNNDLGIVHVVIRAYPDHEELSLVMRASVASVVIRLSMGSFSSVLAV